MGKVVCQDGDHYEDDEDSNHSKNGFCFTVYFQTCCTQESSRCACLRSGAAPGKRSLWQQPLALPTWRKPRPRRTSLDSRHAPSLSLTPRGRSRPSRPSPSASRSTRREARELWPSMTPSQRRRSVSKCMPTPECCAEQTDTHTSSPTQALLCSM